MRGDDAALEGLAQAVCGDKTEAAGLAGADAFRGAVPPIHHVVGGFGDLAVDRAERLGVAIAEFTAHSPIAEERRVANDELSGRPFGASRVDIDRESTRL